VTYKLNLKNYNYNYILNLVGRNKAIVKELANTCRSAYQIQYNYILNLVGRSIGNFLRNRLLSGGS
jgi:hypothetical protein